MSQTCKKLNHLYAQTDRVMITAPDLDLWNLTRKVHAHKNGKMPNNHQQNSKTIDHKSKKCVQ